MTLNLMRQWRDVTDFLPPLRAATRGNADVADLDDGVLLYEVKSAMIEFCEDTKAITAHLNIPLQCGVCEYPIVVDECEDILGVGRAKYGETCDSECLGSRFWAWGDVTFRLVENSDVLVINRSPESDPKILELDVYTAPTREAARVDALLFQRYQNPIIHLTLEKIHLMTGVPWASTTRAQYYRQLYASRAVEVNERRFEQGLVNTFIKPPVRMGSTRRRF